MAKKPTLSSDSRKVKGAGNLQDARELKGGAYTDVKELIEMRYAGRNLNHFKTHAKYNPLSGLLASKFRGRGVDFAEVRIYQPGDEIRSIDWKVTARTQHPHTKLFQIEKERPFYILVDQSTSMFFGSVHALKSVLAAECAALAAWNALHRGDRVGGIIFSEKSSREVRARSSKSSVLRFLYELDHCNRVLSGKPAKGNSPYLSNALFRLRRITKHDSAVLIISDFASLEEQATLQLRDLMQHNQVMGVHISDPLEKELPKPDRYTITNGVTRSHINTSSKQYREDYALNFKNRLKKVKFEFARTGSPLVELSTKQKLVSELAASMSGIRQS